MSEMVEKAGLKVAAELAEFIEERALPSTGLAADAFWHGMADIYARFAPENRRLLGVRDELQAKLDAWHEANPGAPDQPAYQAFLRDIGYLVDEPAPFQVAPRNVDDEVARIAGPQLVVPILNARFLLNAANARWGSLYDALYGTDALGTPPSGGGYDAERGAKVIAWAKAFLDQAVPLKGARWAEIAGFDLSSRSFRAKSRNGDSEQGFATSLEANGMRVGFRGEASGPRRSCSSVTGFTSKWCWTATIRSAATIRPALPT